MPWLSQSELSQWTEGNFVRSYRKFGAHPNKAGSWFAVWAPHAQTVSVVGDFNGWDPSRHKLRKIGQGNGICWEGYVRGARVGQRYKYHIVTHGKGTDKTDPYAFFMEPPVVGGDHAKGMAGIICDSSFRWTDGRWMKTRKGVSSMNEPVSVYEVHLGSWRRKSDGTHFSYRELARPLAEHVSRLGFTHVEFMPVMEHPFYGSWGYQVVGYYSPTYRYGTPDDFRYLVNYLHKKNIGVFLDWVPAHFATDPQALAYFDGEPLFEYHDPLMRDHPDWGTFVFDLVRPEVKNYLISNAIYWLDEFHIDGLRFDAVASMLYRDYSREHWVPNIFGGRENLEAIDFLKRTNEVIFSEIPEAQSIAEESTAWPGVSKPTYDGGLGFLYKWNMGWMHDTLHYFREDPIHRKYHHDQLTFPLVYAFSENYVLPLSHDEVVHGKGSLWNKMPGDDWQKSANLRLLFGHMYGHPGKKLLFMGAEFGQVDEWRWDSELEWALSDVPNHRGITEWIIALNDLYRNHGVLGNDSPESFHWVQFDDKANGVISYIRQNGDKKLLFILNLTPVPRHNYLIHGSMLSGKWRTVLNSDSLEFDGSGVGVEPLLRSKKKGDVVQLECMLPPLAMVIMEKS